MDTTWGMASTSASDPITALTVYGPLGIFALLLIYVVKSLYDRQQKTNDAIVVRLEKQLDDQKEDFESRLDEKNSLLSKQDSTIAMLLQNGQITVPALARTAEVIERLPKALPTTDDMADIKALLPRLADVLERFEVEKST